MASISRLEVEGFRTLEKVQLDLGGLVTLIGLNGSGKSTILEALQILHLVGARQSDFYDCFNKWHGGLHGTFRRAPDWADRLRLGVEVTDGAAVVRYDLTFTEQNGYAAIYSESLALDGQALLMRTAGDVGDAFRGRLHVAPNVLVLPQVAPLVPAALTMLTALGGIDVHLPFFTLPRWAARQHGIRTPMREPATLESTPQRLDLLGTNLVQVFQELRSGGDPNAWRETMELVRLGLGEGIDDIRIRTEQGTLRLELRLKGVRPDIPVHSLSDGQLYYLALVAMVRLESHHAGYFGPRTLLAFDEPELHLHPAALARVVAMFEEAAASHPVLIATQSDAVLDEISDPAASVRVCELDEASWSTSVHALDNAALDKWLAKYRGRLGALRADGYLNVVTGE